MQAQNTRGAAGSGEIYGLVPCRDTSERTLFLEMLTHELDTNGYTPTNADFDNRPGGAGCSGHMPGECPACTESLYCPACCCDVAPNGDGHALECASA